MNKQILKELKNHAPFTVFGAVTGIAIVVFCQKIPFKISYNIFYILHPIHVLLSALVTTSMYELHKCGRFRWKCNLWVLLGMPNRAIHIGFIEKWWLVNPLAIYRYSDSLFQASDKISSCRTCIT